MRIFAGAGGRAGSGVRVRPRSEVLVALWASLRNVAVFVVAYIGVIVGMAKGTRLLGRERPRCRVQCRRARGSCSDCFAPGFLVARGI